MKIFQLFGATILLLPLLGTPAGAQTLDPDFHALTGVYMPGNVNALGPPQADGKRLVGGNFEHLDGTTVSSLVRIDANGKLDEAFSRNVGRVSEMFRIKGAPNGQYLLGHSNDLLQPGISAGGISRSQVLRLNADGTADDTFKEYAGPSSPAGFSYTADFAALPDGKVLLTGGFTHYNNVPAMSIVRLTKTGEVDPDFSVGEGPKTSAMQLSYASLIAVQPDGKIIVSGDFSFFSGHPTSCLARLLPDGRVDPGFTSPLAEAYFETMIVQPDGKLLIAGDFKLKGAAPNSRRSVLIRLLPSGELDPTFEVTERNLSITTVHYDAPIALQPDGKIVASGYFVVNGITSHVIRFSPDGSIDDSFRSDIVPTGNVNTVGVQPDGEILLGGRFSRSDAVETPLLQLTRTGTENLAFRSTPQVPATIRAMVRQKDGKLVLGGNFTEINGQPVHRICRLTTTGALDASFSVPSNTLPRSVSCLALQADDQILVGSDYGVHRLTIDGSLDARFIQQPGLSYVGKLAIQADGRIVVGGSFSRPNSGERERNLVRLTSTGEFDDSFVPPFTAGGKGTLYTATALLVQPDGQLVVAGRFSVENPNQPTEYLFRVIRLEPTGAYDDSFNNLSVISNAAQKFSYDNQVRAMARQPDGKLLIAGDFATVNGTVRKQLARLTATGALDPDFALGTTLTGIVNTLALQPNGRIVVGGRFSTLDQTGTRNNLTRVLENGDTDESFDTYANTNDAVNALLVQPDGAIMLAGDFTRVSFQPNVGVVRITAPHVLHVGAPTAVAERTAAWPVPAHSVLHVAPDQSAQPLAIELLDAVGRQVRHQRVNSTEEFTLNVEQLPAGVYVLRVSYAAGVVTRRVAIQ